MEVVEPEPAPQDADGRAEDRLVHPTNGAAVRCIGIANGENTQRSFSTLTGPRANSPSFRRILPRSRPLESLGVRVPTSSARARGGVLASSRRTWWFDVGSSCQSLANAMMAGALKRPASYHASNRWKWCRMPPSSPGRGPRAATKTEKSRVAFASQDQSGREDSNLRPLDPQSSALTRLRYAPGLSRPPVREVRRGGPYSEARCGARTFAGGNSQTRQLAGCKRPERGLREIRSRAVHGRHGERRHATCVRFPRALASRARERRGSHDDDGELRFACRRRTEGVRRRGVRMTLQRLTKDEPADTAVSRTSLRAKALMTNERLRTLTSRDRTPPAREDESEAALRATGTFETLLGELTRLLSMSFDYTASLQELTRVVAERLDCGCVVDLLEPHGHVRLASVPESRRDRHERIARTPRRRRGRSTSHCRRRGGRGRARRQEAASCRQTRPPRDRLSVDRVRSDRDRGRRGARRADPVRRHRRRIRAATARARARTARGRGRTERAALCLGASCREGATARPLARRPRAEESSRGDPHGDGASARRDEQRRWRHAAPSSSRPSIAPPSA